MKDWQTSSKLLNNAILVEIIKITVAADSSNLHFMIACVNTSLEITLGIQLK